MVVRRKLLLLLLSVGPGLTGCPDRESSDPSTAQTPQTGERAADELCRAATEVAGDPSTADVSHWFGAAESRVEHSGIRAAMEALVQYGGSEPDEVFFDMMADVLGHPWTCPAARRILTPPPK